MSGLSRLLLCALMALVVGAAASRLPMDLEESDEDNELQVNGGLVYQEPQQRPSWVRVSSAPPPILHRSGPAPLLLQCEVMGSPPPAVTWFRDGRPISEDEEDYASNLVDSGSGRGMAKVVSRLLLSGVTPAGRARYTCRGTSGGRAAEAGTTVYHGGVPRNATQYALINTGLLLAPAAPRVLLHYTMLLEDAGADVLLPCRVAGRPRPRISWMDTEERPLSGQDPRFKVLPSGELLIQNLRWTDMGGYTCVASNKHGKDAATTFLYPLTSD